jgi:hypothetical protein
MGNSISGISLRCTPGDILQFYNLTIRFLIFLFIKMFLMILFINKLILLDFTVTSKKTEDVSLSMFHGIPCIKRLF